MFWKEPERGLSSFLDVLCPGAPDSQSVAAMQDFLAENRRSRHVRQDGTPRPVLKDDIDQKTLPVPRKKPTSHPESRTRGVLSGPEAPASETPKPAAPKVNQKSMKFCITNERVPQVVPRGPGLSVKFKVPRRRVTPSALRTPQNEMESFIIRMKGDVRKEIRDAQEKDRNLMSSAKHRLKTVMPDLGTRNVTNKMENYRLFYFNQFLNNGHWSCLWEKSKAAQMPLVLDRSDKALVFLDETDSNGEKRTMRQWNDMGFVSEDFYRPLAVVEQALDSVDIQHAEAAKSLSLIEPNLQDFVNFHKPKLKPANNEKFSIRFEPHFAKANPDQGEPSPYLNDLQELSAVSGLVFLLEHTTEFPPCHLNVGMGTVLTVYWQKETETDNLPAFGTEVNVRVLKPDDQSPFVAAIPKKRTVPALSCHLFKTPVWDHAVNSTDFLLVQPWELVSSNTNLFYLRRFNRILCAGFVEPRKTVMRPNTKEAQTFHDKFIKGVLLNIFRGTEQYAGRDTIRIANVREEFFPDVKEMKLRKLLKDSLKCKFVRDPGYWKWESNSGREFQQLEIIPEDVCLYESMLVGIWRLRQNGVHILTGTTSADLGHKIKQLNGELTKQIAKRIEHELMKTPWARTVNFQGSFQSNAMEMEQADDGQQTFKKRTRRNMDPSEVIQPPKLAKTGNDLRRQTVTGLDTILMSYGMTKAELEILSRWDKVHLVRELTTKSGNLTFGDFIRGARNRVQAMKEAYKKQLQETFENSLQLIMNTNDQGSAKIDDDDFLDGMSLSRNEDEYDDMLDEQEDEGIVQQFRSTGDPVELIPNGVCTTRTHIDWDSLGFAGEKQRKVVKLIHVALNPTGVDVNVEWVRAPSLVDEWSRRGDVCPDPNRVASDLKEKVLRKIHKQIKTRLERLKSKSQETTYQYKYARFDPENWIVDESASDYQFVLKPEVVRRIVAASAKCKRLSDVTRERRKNRSSDASASPLKKKRRSEGHHKRHAGTHPYVRLNRTFKEIFKEVARACRDLSPIERNVYTKCKSKEYTSLDKFKTDLGRDIERIPNPDARREASKRLNQALSEREGEIARLLSRF